MLRAESILVSFNVVKCENSRFSVAVLEALKVIDRGIVVQSPAPDAGRVWARRAAALKGMWMEGGGGGGAIGGGRGRRSLFDLAPGGGGGGGEMATGAG